MSDQKTEAPTPRRREEARRKGEGVGRSSELSMALTLGTGVLGLSALLPGIAATMSSSMSAALIDAGQPGISPAHLMDRFGNGIGQAITLTLPFAMLILVAGVAGNLAAGGLVFSTYSLRFDGSRLNPAQGIRRLVDKQALVRLGVASAKFAVIAFVSWQILVARIPDLVALQGADVGAIAGNAMNAIFAMGLSITVLMTVVALIDFVVQRRRAMGQLKMSKDEVRREYRESEGDPLIQAQRRRRARQIAFARMMDAVPTADVVVTNPTHLAVALKYDSLTMKAPRIVAKGQRLMAERIKAIAREHRVPVVEDVPLARALFPRPVGSEVPPHLYRAIARILVVVHQARFNVRRPAQGRSRTRTDHAPGAGGPGAGRGPNPGRATPGGLSILSPRPAPPTAYWPPQPPDPQSPQPGADR